MARFFDFYPDELKDCEAALALVKAMISRGDIKTINRSGSTITGESIRLAEYNLFGVEHLLVFDIEPCFKHQERLFLKPMKELVDSAEAMGISRKDFTGAWIKNNIELYCQLGRCWGRESTGADVFYEDFKDALWCDDYELPYDEFDSTRFLLSGFFKVISRGASAAKLMRLHGDTGYDATSERGIHGRILGFVVADNKEQEFRYWGV